jgi:acyl-CoA thioesterase FadM
MSGFMTKWAVLREHQVTADDLGTDGTVSDQAVGRWVDGACSAYLDGCALLRRARDRDGLDVRHRPATLPRGASLGQPTSLVVTASATEIRPSSFTVAVRLRPAGGDREVAVNASCVVRLEDRATGAAQPIGTDLRDELIAIEHAARHYN